MENSTGHATTDWPVLVGLGPHRGVGWEEEGEYFVSHEVAKCLQVPSGGMPIKEEEVWSVISLVLFPLQKVEAVVEECVLRHTTIFGTLDAKPTWVDLFEVVLWPCSRI